MVHVDLERDCEPRIELAMGLADRFQATLIGVAGCATWPAFMAGDLELTKSNQYEFQKIMARFAQRGEKFRAEGQWLKQVEWRSMLESPGELLLREARAADLLVIGRRRSGVLLLRAGRPIPLVPDTAHPLELRRVVVAWKDTRECRRAVRDALPLLQEAKEVLARRSRRASRPRAVEGDFGGRGGVSRAPPGYRCRPGMVPPTRTGRPRALPICERRECGL
jgi:nucleotide-binding universal stress UspA family protein